jgi:hypothetical protein
MAWKVGSSWCCPGGDLGDRMGTLTCYSFIVHGVGFLSGAGGLRGQGLVVGRVTWEGRPCKVLLSGHPEQVGDPGVHDSTLHGTRSQT